MAGSKIMNKNMHNKVRLTVISPLLVNYEYIFEKCKEYNFLDVCEIGYFNVYEDKDVFDIPKREIYIISNRYIDCFLRIIGHIKQVSPYSDIFVLGNLELEDNGSSLRLINFLITGQLEEDLDNFNEITDKINDIYLTSHKLEEISSKLNIWKKTNIQARNGL